MIDALLAAILTFVLGDSITTILGRNKGAEEAHPIGRWFLKKGAENSSAVMIGIKSLIVVIVYLGSTQLHSGYRWIPLTVLAVIGAGITMWNSYVIKRIESQ